MKFELNDGVLTLFLEGRIDSNNAQSVETDIIGLYEFHKHENTILDLGALDYISSAGLRTVLRLKKMDPSLKLINVKSEVYEIFDMTGFTEMMTIEKAYKKISIEGCEEVGHGANGKVYRIDNDTIVKVYNDPDCLDDIKRERALAKKAFVLGIPTAISYDIVKVGDSYGTVFELLESKSFAKLLKEDVKNIDKYVDMYVDLLKKIHATKCDDDDMVDMRQTAINWAQFDKEYLPVEIGDKLVSLVKAVPHDSHMLHGDFHIKNVMMQKNEVLLIDMDTLCVGNPIFELGSMFNAYKGFSTSDHNRVKDFLGIDYDTSEKFWYLSLKKYLGIDDMDKILEIEKKAAIVGYMRLLRRKIRRGGLEDQEGRKLVDLYASKLTELVPQVDTLLI